MKLSRRQFIDTSGLLVSLAILGTVSNCANEEKMSKRPNIICFMSDELSFDYIGEFGGNFSTPNIDSLTEQGVKFTNAYSAAPMCTPSRYGLLTGQYPGRCSHPSFLRAFPGDQPYSIAWNTYISPSVQSIPRILSANGYRTGMAGKWHIGQIPNTANAPRFNFEDDPTDPEIDTKLRRMQEICVEQVKQDAGFDYAASVLWGNFDGLPVQKLRYHNFPWITKGAVEFLEQQATNDQPFFLYSATTAIHGPSHLQAFSEDMRYTPAGKIDDVTDYQIPRDGLRQKLENAPETGIAAGMMSLDHHIGVIMNKLEELGMSDNTIVFFIPDHNREPGKATCYEKGFRIPMILKWPGKLSSKITSDALVQTVDVLPTILDLAGVSLPSDGAFDGKSIVPLIEGKSEEIRDYVYMESGYARAVTDGEYKYIAVRFPENVIEQMKDGSMEYAPNHMNIFQQAHSQIALECYPGYFDQNQLYDLQNDPYEQNNIADDPEYRDTLQRLRGALEQQLAKFDHPYNLDDIEFMETEAYKNLVQNTRSLGTDFIPWYRGNIVWPPE